MSKNLSTKYYQEHVKDIKIFLNEEREKKQHGHEHHKNLYEDEKNKVVE